MFHRRDGWIGQCFTSCYNPFMPQIPVPARKYITSNLSNEKHNKLCVFVLMLFLWFFVLLVVVSLALVQKLVTSAVIFGLLMDLFSLVRVWDFLEANINLQSKLNYFFSRFDLFQSIIFRVQQHPQVPGFTQCVTFGFFRTPGMETAYNLFCVIAMYFMPLMIISAAYTVILCEISNRSREKGRFA